jgi:hypothetical protein
MLCKQWILLVQFVTRQEDTVKLAVAFIRAIFHAEHYQMSVSPEAYSTFTNSGIGSVTVSNTWGRFEPTSQSPHCCPNWQGKDELRYLLVNTYGAQLFRYRPLIITDLELAPAGLNYLPTVGTCLRRLDVDLDNFRRESDDRAR